MRKVGLSKQEWLTPGDFAQKMKECKHRKKRQRQNFQKFVEKHFPSHCLTRPEVPKRRRRKQTKGAAFTRLARAEELAVKKMWKHWYYYDHKRRRRIKCRYSPAETFAFSKAFVKLFHSIFEVIGEPLYAAMYQRILQDLERRKRSRNA